MAVHLGPLATLPEEKQAEKKLFVVEGDNLKKYNEALAKMGFDAIKLEGFEIDRRGYSLQVAQEVKKSDYLETRMIIISQEQASAPLLMENDYTFMPKLLDKVYSASSNLIKKFTPYEALMGSVLVVPKMDSAKDLIEILNDSKANMGHVRESMIKTGLLTPNHASPNFVISTALDTPNSTVQKIYGLIREINRLDKESALVLDNSYLDKLLLEIKGINEVYGPVKNLEASMLAIPSVYMDSFKLKKKGTDIYVLSKGEKTLVLYFGKKLKKSKDVVNGNDKEELLFSLLDHNFAQVDKELAEKRLKEIETGVLFGAEKQTEGLCIMEKYRRLESIKQDIPKEERRKLDELWKVIRDKKSFSSLSFDLKFEMVILTCDEPLVKEALRRAQIA